MKKIYLNAIRKNLNLLTTDQLYLLFQIYLQLDYHCDFFMSEESHVNFINLFYETPCNRNPLTFKTLITLLTTKFTPEENYPLVLETIDMIQKDFSLITIINTLYNYYQTQNNILNES